MEPIMSKRFLILTDPIAQKWIEQKSLDIDRWLKGMRRLNARIEQETR